LLYAKGHSAQPDMFLKTHHTKPDPKPMRVMPFCLWGVWTRLEIRNDSAEI
jgi:hypothetical protein